MEIITRGPWSLLAACEKQHEGHQRERRIKGEQEVRNSDSENSQAEHSKDHRTELAAPSARGERDADRTPDARLDGPTLRAGEPRTNRHNFGARGDECRRQAGSRVEANRE